MTALKEKSKTAAPEGETRGLASCSEQQRTACAIGGAYTALAIENVLPVLHAGPGCIQNAGAVIANLNGAQRGVSYVNSIIPSTNFCDKDVVFGAAGRLRKLVSKSLEYYKTDMLMLFDGCSSEIVGDDIEEVASDFADSPIPVLWAKLPGFKGNNLWGHAQVLNSIADQYLVKLPRGEKNPKQVNIFGIVPYYDTYWMGDVEELEKMLTGLGLEPNIIYGRGHGIEEIKKIPQAAFNLVLAPWTDLEYARHLQDLFGTPFFHYPCLPVGPTETARFIRSLAKFAGLDQINAEAYIKREEERYYFYIFNSVGGFLGGPQTPRRFYVNASAAAAVSITRFLVNDMGRTPIKVYITDDVPPEYQEGIVRALRDINSVDTEDFEIVFTNDGGLCAAEIENETYKYKKVCFFGTCWDQLFANNKGLPFVAISAPSGDVIAAANTRLGYNGALNFLRDMLRDLSQKILGSGIVAKLEEQPADH
jgi:nitrogenase molybdenum-iron protein beta chain